MITPNEMGDEFSRPDVEPHGLEAVVKECGGSALAQAIPRAAKAGGFPINPGFAQRPDPCRKIQRSLIRSRSAHECKDRWNLEFGAAEVVRIYGRN